jgi:hypothetical protein
MTTPTTNLKMSDIQTEFGGTNPAALSEYYRGGANVPIGQVTSATDGVAISTTGTIRMGMFRGLSKVFSFSQTISASTANYNLRTAAIAAGWNGTTPISATVTVNAGIFVYSASTGTAAFDTGSIPAGSTVSLVNNGYIIGAGGAGGAGSTVPNATANSFGAAVAGSAGGNAIQAQYSVSITNNGIIGGGGGGGGGSGAAKTDVDGKGTIYGAPGSGGGGGRGGISLTACGTGGAGSTAVGCSNNLTAGAGSNVASNTTAAGAGGLGGSRAVIGGVIGAGTGGTGGGWGAAGAAGTAADSSSPSYVNYGYTGGAAGGAAGNCTLTTGGTLSWVATGTRYGTVA